MITYADFEKINIRLGKIIQVDDFPQARKPAYKLIIDFRDNIGTKKSSAQITDHYTKEELLNSLVLCVINFPPRQIGSFISEVLTLGLADKDGKIILVRPENDQAVIGGKLF